MDTLISHEATRFVNGSDKQSCHVGYMKDGTGVQWEHNVEVEFKRLTSKNMNGISCREKLELSS